MTDLRRLILRKKKKFRKDRKICQKCSERPAKFICRYRNKKFVVRLGRKAFAKSDRHHQFCPRCFRSELQSSLARQIQADA